MKTKIEEIADELYDDLEVFFQPDMSDRHKEVARKVIMRAIKNTVVETNSFITRTLLDSVSKASRS
jgi:hypothetical protein